jgi:thymidylate synthase (FAD)
VARSRLKIILLKYTIDPEETVALAAKLCYSPSDVEVLKNRIEAKDQRAFIEKLMKMGHISPVEHASFTFAIEGISRACSHQLIRHRIASYSQQSQRYVPAEEGFNYIIPPVIQKDKNLKKYFEDFMAKTQAAYQYLIKGLNEKGIQGEAANQDARFVLPNAMETKIIVTMNARELLHFFTMRCCNRAQWEIRQMAEGMLKVVKSVAPTLFAKAGPGCLYAPCPEGDYTCGKSKEMRNKYQARVK